MCAQLLLTELEMFIHVSVLLTRKLNILMQENTLFFHTSFENNLVSVESPGQRM